MFKDQTKDIASGRVRLQKNWSNLRTFCQMPLDGFQWAVVDAATNRKWLFGICHFVLMPCFFFLSSWCCLCLSAKHVWHQSDPVTLPVPVHWFQFISSYMDGCWKILECKQSMCAGNVSDACSCLYERDGWVGVVLCWIRLHHKTRPRWNDSPEKGHLGNRSGSCFDPLHCILFARLWFGFVQNKCIGFR
jgi:hypothetical protein